MAKVEVDLSEYDMMREAKKNAETRVTELTEEVKKLKDTASNVVVKNRYYVPMLDYNAAANRIITNLGMTGLYQLCSIAGRAARSMQIDPCSPGPAIDPNAMRQVADLIKHSLSDMLEMRKSYVEDAVSVEVRGFSEVADQIREKYEKQYRDSFKFKEEELENQKRQYDVARLDVEKSVSEAEAKLTKKYEAKIEKLEKEIDELKDKNKELSKTSQEKYDEAVTKLKEAQAEVDRYKAVEKVVYVEKPRKKFLGIF